MIHMILNQLKSHLLLSLGPDVRQSLISVQKRVPWRACYARRQAEKKNTTKLKNKPTAENINEVCVYFAYTSSHQEIKEKHKLAPNQVAAAQIP